MKTQKVILLSTSAIVLGSSLWLLASHAIAAAEKPQVNIADARFIQNEAAAGVALVHMAELGQRNAHREDVKDFAVMLVATHTKANAELETLAARKGVKLTPEPSTKSRDVQDSLEAASESDFDKQFLSLVVSAHEKNVINFQEAAQGAEDIDVKAWAAIMLPDLQAHLRQAQELSSASMPQEGVTSTTRPGSQPVHAASNTLEPAAHSLTPLNHGNNKADIETTAEIRKGIIAYEGLSVNARNVRVITTDGRVTLRGPVNSADEKRIIGEIANGIVTSQRTDNQLEVASDAASN